MFELNNEFLSIKINAFGAELHSIFNHKNKVEYLWQGDAQFWAKRSPILFPIVGQLIGNQYTYNGKTYSLPRHGFARERKFECIKQENDLLVFQLASNEETALIFPFKFQLNISYQLNKDQLVVAYQVKNLDADELYFSIGAHPAFNVPLLPNEQFEDYYLQFSENETASRWTLQDGLIDQPIDWYKNESIQPLNRTVLADDALVFKHLKSSSAQLLSKNHQHGVQVDFDGFPYLGIWCATDAPFLCIEPWCGIADSIGHDGNLANKEGIISLAPSAIWNNQYVITVQ